MADNGSSPADTNDDEDDTSRTNDRDDARLDSVRGDANADATGNDGETAVSEDPDFDEQNGHDGEDETGDGNEDKDVEGEDGIGEENNTAEPTVPADVKRYERFKKMDGATYERANGFLRDRTYITAREWAIARLCTDFRTETGVEMTKIGQNLPRLVPFMTDTYTPQAVNQARASFENKIRKAGATFLYGAMTDLFTAEELDDVMYEATEVAKFLLEVEGADLAVDAELAAEDRIQSVMREVHRQSAALRHDDVTCPHCGHEFDPSAETTLEDDAATE